MKKEIKKIQTAIFYKNFQLGNTYDKSKILLELREKVGSIFDGEPIMFPIPFGTPPEIPRIILNSKDGIYSCHVALDRTYVFYNATENLENIDRVLSKQKDNSLKLFDFLKSKNSIINRVGFIIEFEITIDDENGSEYLKKEFFLDSKFTDPKELTFRYNKADKTKGETGMNNLITVLGKADRVVKVQLDINSIAETMDNSDFTKENFTEIIDYAIIKIPPILEKFPIFEL
ncbi:MAG: hypothetical protein Q8N37_01965 [bacterium]|nr:hypothetical protein [bacterium]